MLQSIISAVFLYHVIKAIARHRKRATKPAAPPAPVNTAVNHTTPEAPQPFDVFADRLTPLMKDRPWLKRGVELARTPVALRALVLGSIFSLLGIFLTPFGLYCVIDSVTGPPGPNDSLLGSLIMTGIGAIALTAGFLQARDGLRLLRRGKSGSQMVTGATPYAAPKPQPAGIIKKRTDKQFQQL